MNLHEYQSKRIFAQHGIPIPTGEVATGQINEGVLREAAEITGGTYLTAPDEKLELTGSDVSRYVELWPLFLKLFILLFFVDVAIRRWENLMGLWEQATGWFGGKRRPA